MMGAAELPREVLLFLMIKKGWKYKQSQWMRNNIGNLEYEGKVHGEARHL